MRRVFVFAVLALALAAAVACATSGAEEEATPPPGPPVDASVILDGGPADAGRDVTPGLPTCSDAGWCVTALPDSDLTLKDIWPLPSRAFAIAESPTLGVKILEWDDADPTWKYIDDATQNEPGLGKYAGKIWAPDENEIYFAVAPGYIYHGRRSAAPATAWAWTRDRLEGTSDAGPGDPALPMNSSLGYGVRYPALGVWGTGPGDVYAWHANTVYHWTSDDGGAPAWVAEYVADDAALGEQLYILGAVGTRREDIWFTGARQGGEYQYSCAILVRKTVAGYRRIADGTLATDYIAPPSYPSAPPSPPTCNARAGDGGLIRIGGADGWLTDLQALADDRLVGLKGSRDVARISVDGGSYAMTFTPVPRTDSARPLTSLWGTPQKSWLTGWGVIIEDTSSWDAGAEAGVFGISTISLSGAPIDRSLYQVRGSSNTNLWAIGVRYAFHKTTP